MEIQQALLFFVFGFKVMENHDLCPVIICMILLRNGGTFVFKIVMLGNIELEILHLNINRTLERLFCTFMYQIKGIDQVIIQHKRVERKIARKSWRENN